MKNTSYLSIILFFCLGFFQNCTTPEQKTPQNSPFYVDDASHLYFKNMRAFYYDQKPSPQANTDLFQFQKIKTNPKTPSIIPVIVDRWINDEAYLFLETNDFEEGFSQPLQFRWISEKDTLSLKMNSRLPTDQFTFAQEVEKLLAANHDLWVETAKGDWRPIFKAPKEKIYFQITLKDYYRLIQWSSK